MDFIDYLSSKHITNIAPAQINKVALLGIIKKRYGTEKELIEEYIGSLLSP